MEAIAEVIVALAKILVNYATTPRADLAAEMRKAINMLDAAVGILESEFMSDDTQADDKLAGRFKP